MIIQEQWKMWKPLQNLANEYEIEQISNGKDGFKIILCESNNDKNGLTMLFQDSVWAYKYTYESFRQKIIDNLDKEYGTDFYKNWTFFKVTNSEYLAWLSDQAYGLTESLSLIHLAILTPEFIVDIISNYEPKIDLTENK